MSIFPACSSYVYIYLIYNSVNVYPLILSRYVYVYNAYNIIKSYYSNHSELDGNRDGFKFSHSSSWPAIHNVSSSRSTVCQGSTLLQFLLQNQTKAKSIYMIPTMSSNPSFSALWPSNSHPIHRPSCYHLTITQSSMPFWQLLTP